MYRKIIHTGQLRKADSMLISLVARMNFRRAWTWFRKYNRKDPHLYFLEKYKQRADRPEYADQAFQSYKNRMSTLGRLNIAKRYFLDQLAKMSQEGYGR